MNVLVFNCGSSSLSYKIFESTGPDSLKVTLSGKAHRVGVKGSQPSFIEHHLGNETCRQVVPIPDHARAAHLALYYVRQKTLKPDVIGHRFVHGGSLFHQSARLDRASLARLEACLPLAPIHNPNSMSVICLCRRELPAVPQYVTFDTAFHAHLPAAATTYALPQEMVRRYGLRKYGFHGLSYQDVTRTITQHLGQSGMEERFVVCHLGTGGSSVAAIRDGRSIETSMGYSPLSGLVMSTRTGDLDVGASLYLLRQLGFQAADLDNLYNKESGLLGLSGTSSDIRDLLQLRDEGDYRADLAVETYVFRLRQHVGGCVAILGGLDVLAFTDDVGLGCWQIRSMACREMEWAGIRLDEETNRRATPDRLCRLDDGGLPVRVLSVPNDEERVIGLEGLRLFGRQTHADF